jgi:hypothetical protein
MQQKIIQHVTQCDHVLTREHSSARPTLFFDTIIRDPHTWSVHVASPVSRFKNISRRGSWLQHEQIAVPVAYRLMLSTYVVKLVVILHITCQRVARHLPVML